ncbi:hypothetical protein ACTSKR_16550 [Chitinibacteraceae bacterium HSL-7]
MYLTKSRAPGPVSAYAATTEDTPTRAVLAHRAPPEALPYAAPQWDGTERRAGEDRRQQSERRGRTNGGMLFDTRSMHERRRQGRRVTDRAVALSLKV